jgi:hypothetical protein
MGEEMAKKLFTIKPHSIIDVITNSSSELFVGKSQNKDEIRAVIKAIYPEYLNEYEEIKTTDELTVSELELYLSYKGYYETNDYDSHWFDKIQNLEEEKEKLDPNKEMFFLFSLDDNPNWEMQEKLSNFMTRYHLG